MLRCVVFVVAGLAIAGCSSAYRGIPSHGGGKRFSEEQRMVAGAIRQAIASMDLTELKGKRVALTLTGLPSEGGGNINWGGFSMSANGSVRDSVKDLSRITVPTYEEETKDSSTSLGGNFSFRPNHNFYSNVRNTNADINYLKAALEMKALHEGFRFVSQKPEASLHVLVDVLGTNRSRTNWLLFHADELKAECELSYFAIDTANQDFYFRSRQCSAEGVYSHTRCIVAPIKPFVKRTISETEPTALPGGDEQDVTLPTNGDHSGDDEGTSVNGMDAEEKERYVESMANRLRAQVSNGELKEARDTLRQIIAVDPNYEELPELANEIKDEHDKK